MAGPVPPSPGENTSYSDPLYDRLDTFVKGLSQRWGIVVVAVIVAAVLVVVLRYSLDNAPAAASAAALADARMTGVDALSALVDDEKITVEFRARAAAEAGRLYLTERKPTPAIDMADKGLALAEAAQITPLIASLTMIKGAAAEQAGDLDLAIQYYDRAAGTRLEGYAVSADLAGALLRSLRAEAVLAKPLEGDGAASADERADAEQDLLDALNALQIQSTSTDRTTALLTELATWNYYELRRRYPAVAAKFDESLGN